MQPIIYRLGTHQNLLVGWALMGSVPRTLSVLATCTFHGMYSSHVNGSLYAMSKDAPPDVGPSKWTVHRSLCLQH